MTPEGWGVHGAAVQQTPNRARLFPFSGRAYNPSRYMAAISFSIVVPTRNEASDIAATLGHAARQTLPASEIIVVDDSEDETPQIVESVQAEFPVVRLLRGEGTGRAGARNNGILASRSDVVVVLNADVLLPPDFLERLQRHYASGAGHVLVGWRAANPDSALARFVEAQSYARYASDESILWTEGFSCRRELAIQAGMFPVTPVPLVAGEDWPFGQAVAALGRRVLDRSIVVSFVVPVQPRAFWRTYKERGYPHAHYFVLGRSLPAIAARTVAKQVIRAFETLLVVPELWRCWAVARRSRRGRRDFAPFLAADLFQKAALTAGEWEGLARLASGLRAAARREGAGGSA